MLTLRSDARGEIVFFHQMRAGNRKKRNGIIRQKYMQKLGVEFDIIGPALFVLSIFQILAILAKTWYSSKEHPQ